MRGRLVTEEGFSKLGGLNLTREELVSFDQVYMTACGTSWHSGLIGEMYIEDMARIRAKRPTRSPRCAKRNAAGPRRSAWSTWSGRRSLVRTTAACTSTPDRRS